MFKASFYLAQTKNEGYLFCVQEKATDILSRSFELLTFLLRGGIFTNLETSLEFINTNKNYTNK